MIVFLAAAVTEGLYYLWTRCERPWLLALISGALATGQVIGLAGAIQGAAVQYVLGYAAGSFVAGLAARRWASLKGDPQSRPVPTRGA